MRSPLFRRPDGAKLPRRMIRRTLFIECLESRELLSTAQERLLASLHNNSNSQMVHQDAGNAVRYLNGIAQQIQQVVADQNYALNQDINQARQDKVQAQANGDTATAEADSRAIAQDFQEERALANIVDRGTSFLSAADRQLLGIASTETRQTIANDRGDLRGTESPDQSMAISDSQSAINDQRIADAVNRDFSKVQQITDQILNLNPNFDPNNGSGDSNNLPSPPNPVFTPSSGGNTPGGGIQRAGSPLKGNWSGTYTETRFVNGLTYHDSGNLMVNFSAPATDLNSASLTGLQILDPNTGAVLGTEGTINGNVESKVTTTGYSGAFRFIALDANQKPGEIDINPWDATLSGNTLSGTYTNGTTKGTFTLKKQ